MSGTRGIEESIEIRATPESVWAALTEADQITRWFAPSAAATRGVGGALDLQWGAEVSWPMVIRVWDPPRRVRLEDRYPVIDALKNGTHTELFIDYFVEPKGGGVTRLRVVHSGFSDEDSWDGLYESTGCGWCCEIAALKFYMERCARQMREWVWLIREARCPLDEAWGRVLGAGGLAIDRLNDAERESVVVRAAWRGDAPEPMTVLRSKAGRGLVLAPAETPGVMMMVNSEPAQTPGGKRMAMVRFNLYEGSRALAPALRQEWGTRLEKLFA